MYFKLVDPNDLRLFWLKSEKQAFWPFFVEMRRTEPGNLVQSLTTKYQRVFFFWINHIPSWFQFSHRFNEGGGDGWALHQSGSKKEISNLLRYLNREHSMQDICTGPGGAGADRECGGSPEISSSRKSLPL